MKLMTFIFLMCMLICGCTAFQTIRAVQRWPARVWCTSIQPPKLPDAYSMLTPSERMLYLQIIAGKDDLIKILKKDSENLELNVLTTTAKVSAVFKMRVLIQCYLKIIYPNLTLTGGYEQLRSEMLQTDILYIKYVTIYQSQS